MHQHVIIEDFVPYDRSVHWRLHDAYFAQRGIDAWREGEVPYQSTTNYAVATMQANLLVALARDLERAGALASDDEVWVLEVGAGLGQFAANFMRALDASCGPEGRALAPRVRYVASDYSPRSLTEALETPELAPWVASGRLMGAHYDLRDPTTMRLYGGAALPHPPLLVIASYIADSIACKQLQRRGAHWFESHVQVRAPLHDGEPPTADAVLERLLADARQRDLARELELHYEWHPVDLDAALGAPHADLVRHATSGLDQVTLHYPIAFFSFALAMAQLLRPGGGLLVSDYGTVTRDQLALLRERRPAVYGNSWTHEVDFALFDALGALPGWQTLRTRDPLLSVHTALVRPSAPPGGALARDFARLYLHGHAGEDMLDFAAAARQATQAQDHARAARLWRRCLALDPASAELHYRLGEACIDAGHYARAIDTLEAGRALDPTHRFDFEFHLARAHCLRGDAAEAERWYRAALALEEDPVTWTNLGVLLESARRFDEAYRAFKRALVLDPDATRTQERLALLKDRWWQQQVASLAPAERPVTPDATRPPPPSRLVEPTS